MVENSGHIGHRERMRERFRKHFDLNGFTELEVLEMLLFSAIPRADTHDTAQSLLNTFGNIRTVLSADIDSLCKVRGVGLRCAEHLIFMGQVFRRAEKESFISVQADDPDSLSEYLTNFFYGDTTERLCAFSINKAGKLTACSVLTVGISDRLAFDITELKIFLLHNSADMLLLAHNHPTGSSKPSDEDIVLTRKLRNMLEDQVCLIDHIIVGTDGVSSMRALGCFRPFE